MSSNDSPRPDAERDAEMRRLHKLGALPQARLDGNFLCKVQELSIAAEAMRFALISTQVDCRTTPVGTAADYRTRWTVQHWLIDNLFIMLHIKISEIHALTSAILAAD